MSIYNQRPRRSLSNHSLLEAHRSSNSTLVIFLQQYSNEKVLKKKFNVGDTVQINRTSDIFEKGNYLWSTELFNVSKVLDTKAVTYRLHDMKDEEILGGYELQKVKITGMYQIEKIYV